MIAKLDIKKCPFRREIKMTNYSVTGSGNGVVDTTHEETFMECIESDCMAWDAKAKDCRLMMQPPKEEKK